MSREGLSDKLLARGISVDSFVYGQQQVSVYKGKYQQYQVAVKILLVSSPEQFAQGEKEFQTMTRLYHPTILRVYHYFPETQYDKQYQVFVTEWCPKDLAKDADDRRKNNFPWREDELWVVILKLIDGFRYMQERGFAHRDIKPANIFYELRQDVKIGDLGSTTTNPAEWVDVVGTPQYLSPLLRTAMTHRTPCYHNAYKSDVYSLGITIYELASLQVAVFRGITISQEMTNQVVDSLLCSDNLKGLLKTMLLVEERDRPDFIQLDKWTKPVPLDPVDPPLQDQRPPSNEKTMQRSTPTVPEDPGDDLEKTLVIAKHEQPEEEKSLPPLPSVERQKCLHCFREVDVTHRDSMAKVVQLECSPSEHVFCSQSCFVVWSYGQPKVSAECPVCRAPIAIEVIKSYLDLETDDEDQPIEHLTSQPVEDAFSSVPGRPSTDPLLPRQATRDNTQGGAENPRNTQTSFSAYFCSFFSGLCDPRRMFSSTPPNP